MSTAGTTVTLESFDDVLLRHIMSFFVAEEGIDGHGLIALSCVCKRFQTLASSGPLWRDIPLIMKNGSFNLSVFQLIKKRAIGSEGTTFKTFCLPHQREYAVRRCRAYPSNCESVPYYMLRALAALRRLDHPNITSLLFTSLHNELLFSVFPYAEHTLEDVLLSKGSLAPAVSLAWVKQLTEGINCLHSCGLMHRNLKPKHVLVFPGNDGMASLEGCTLKIADFMAVRFLPKHPLQRDTLTSECVSLWYRSPELLMGERKYGFGVDLWSLGAVFAEMILGQPLFRGMSEIEQLFQIFSLLGTPTTDTPEVDNDENNSRSWTAFNSMPNFQDDIFPKWKVSKLSALIFDKSTFRNAPERNDVLDLLEKLLLCDPSARITAAEALRHPLIRPSTTEVAAAEGVAAVAHPSSRSEEHRSTCRPRTNNPIGLQQTNKPTSLSSAQWESTVDWLLDAGDNFRGESLSSSRRREYLAVGILQKYFDVAVVESSNDNDHSATWKQESLLYVAAACLHIASKLDDVSFISAKDILRSLPIFTPAASLDSTIQWMLSRLLGQEEVVLNTLQFDLYPPTDTMLIDALLGFVGDGPVLSFMQFLGELTLLFAPKFAPFPVTQLAAAIYAYAARCFSIQTTTSSSSSAVDDISKSKCFHSIVAEHARFHLEYRNSTLFHRYSRIENHEVSHIAPRR